MMARTLAIACLILIAVATRLVPHLDNVSPVLALALFGGTYLRNRTMAFLIPLVVRLLSDLALVRTYGVQSLYDTPFVFLSLILVVMIGWWVRRTHYNTAATISAALTGSILFFIITNFGVWARQPWFPMWPGYELPMTVPGLITCYIRAIPFFWNTLAGDMAFTVFLFGGFWIAEHSISAVQEHRPTAAPSQGEES